MSTPHVERIAYRDGYKYQLADFYSVDVQLLPPDHIETRWVSLSADGVLTIREGYAWDGPSGPTVDTPAFMRGALVHDALYQLIREGYLPEGCREHADRLLRDICKQDGMSRVRAWWVYRAVRRFGGHAVHHEKPVRYAPTQG